MSQAIPRTFHFVYGLRPQTQPFHLIHYLCLTSCLHVNKPDLTILHCHHEPWGEYWDMIRDCVEIVRVPRPKVRLRYDDPRVEFYRYAHESDFVRLDALIEHGGVYADMDTIFVNPIPDRLFEKDFVLGREDDIVCERTSVSRASLCNAFIMSKPRAEFGARWRSLMETAFDGSWSSHSTLLPCVLAQKNPDLIHIEPARTFYPFMWTPNDLRRLLEGCETVDASVASIHLWAHLWWSERRRDFSDVHGGMFTESYIRQADTTYNLLARRFLPPATRPPRGIARRIAEIPARAAGYAQESVARVRRRIGKMRHGLTARKGAAK